ncbi:vacuolar protein sorting-associated protein VTA1 homolog [Paramacrobiotus metropolitanus]|uniref:vacuolar protein sorting-associated protein VTA1 homolog n=1 Tax=Paramacrobiotus metropolitanus TaxID=2943436 RepID=UPI002445E9F6|nr:vacuolar protein sorting-associated protein VTA1 homolog [Paramacrobiotus metropolitanus]
MAALANLPACPDNLKPMLHYIKAAVEHDNRDPVVAYWLRYHAVQLGIRIDSKSKPASLFISGVLNHLESTKKSQKGNEAITNDMVAQAHIENYALKLFSWADAQDRAGHFDKNVIKAFYTAGLLFDVLAVWGEVSDDVARQQKYAKWKAAYIHNCLKNGEVPVPGPLAEGGDGEANEDPGSINVNVPSSQIPGQNVPSFSTGGSMPSPEKPSFPPGPTYGSDFGNSANPSTFRTDFPPAKPPSTLPVAPPRASVQTPSPSAERRGHVSVVTNPAGIPLSSDDIARAQKNMKHAGSALQFDDAATAIDLLERTLRLLKTGREE